MSSTVSLMLETCILYASHEFGIYVLPLFLVGVPLLPLSLWVHFLIRALKNLLGELLEVTKGGGVDVVVGELTLVIMSRLNSHLDRRDVALPINLRLIP